MQNLAAFLTYLLKMLQSLMKQRASNLMHA